MPSRESAPPALIGLVVEKPTPVVDVKITSVQPGPSIFTLMRLIARPDGSVSEQPADERALKVSRLVNVFGMSSPPSRVVLTAAEAGLTTPATSAPEASAVAAVTAATRAKREVMSLGVSL